MLVCEIRIITYRNIAKNAHGMVFKSSHEQRQDHVVPVFCPAQRLKAAQILLEALLDVNQRNVVRMVPEPGDNLLTEFGVRLEQEAVFLLLHQFANAEQINT